MSTVVLLSGGMDSLISWRLFYPTARIMFVFTGACYQEYDYSRAQMLALLGRGSLETLQGPELTELPSGVVPHRNCILLAYVANMTGASEIVVSAPRGELIWDQQPAFHRAMERVLKGVKILNPLRRLTKTQAVAQYLHRHGPRDLLLTRSCYSGQDRGQCGACPACVKRWVALSLNELEERYSAPVKEHALKIAKEGGSLLNAWRYGWRPLYEAWKATR